MAERIDIRIYARDDGLIRAYAERKLVPGIHLGSGAEPAELAWPLEFADDTDFHTHTSVGDILFSVLVALEQARRAHDDEDPADAEGSPAAPSD